MDMLPLEHTLLRHKIDEKVSSPHCSRSIDPIARQEVGEELPALFH